MESPLTFESFQRAAERLKNVVTRTPLIENLHLSEKYKAHIYLKREDLQIVRSYKIRGAYNKMASLPKEALEKGVVCASAGNHAQGVAYACRKMNVRGDIFMPSTTPEQKVKQVKMFGNGAVTIHLVGDTYDDSYQSSREFTDLHRSTFVHPFDDAEVILGQGTVGLEILEDADFPIDFMLMAIGGGGLASGVSEVFKLLSPNTHLLGVEPLGAPSMKKSLDEGRVVTLDSIDKFVDGAAVRTVGDLTFEICKRNLEEVILVPEGRVCSALLKLYNEDAIVAEPAGALTVAALDYVRDQIVGKNVVLLVSGGNNDITRTEEIRERSLLFEGLKHYFMIRFPQRSGALREFLAVLGPDDDITRFEYVKKTSREHGPALVGIELHNPDDFDSLMERMQASNIEFQYLNDTPYLFQFVV